ncbi:hypothetical protein [Clostridium algidicarnis]|uniref:Uncharacterized protein n=2 Tax=Clostridium algidicarnis TaxID=37659 RepID=A0A2S6FVU9_9CLOT|nr:hypothetical protein [Clostridium algidicarnis]MBB6629948.1 hypothetical protein [Clostridium algidicarnis]MBB6697037.1 hypothetical protein [Clostridium algidicarnis]MBU3193389.1 hypothetical protein [Clostridium algidicarnis]MBU3197274.1 hypothetical protein [Clostridium algidicarnis]MBU3204742.1 hypothetical protein [Clostridium algidicarnis]
MNKDFQNKNINQSMEQKSKESRESKTGYKNRGNCALEAGIRNTKGKR